MRRVSTIVDDAAAATSSSRHRPKWPILQTAESPETIKYAKSDQLVRVSPEDRQDERPVDAEPAARQTEQGCLQVDVEPQPVHDQPGHL